MRKTYLRKGNGFLLVFDLSNKQSLDFIISMYKEMLKTRQALKVPVVIVGNKSDLPVRQYCKEGHRFAQSIKCPYIETSAKYHQDVKSCFTAVVHQVNKDRKRTSKPKRKEKCAIM
jgi:GTPase SAR1 family protein